MAPQQKAGKTGVASASGSEEIGFFEHWWLRLTDMEYNRKAKSPSRTDKKLVELCEINRKHGVFYGYTNDQKGIVAKGVYESTRGAKPLAEIVANVATLPFGGAGSVGKLFAGRLVRSGTIRAATLAKVVDSLGVEIAKVGVDMLAGKEIDYKKRALDIAGVVALAGLGAGARKKLVPALEKGFVRLAEKLKHFRLGKLKGGQVLTAEQAVESGIVEEAVGTIVDVTQWVGVYFLDSLGLLGFLK